MPSLRHCLQLHGFAPGGPEARAILQISRQHRADGATLVEANNLAVSDYAAEVARDRETVIKQIEQHLTQPVEPQAPTPETKDATEKKALDYLPEEIQRLFQNDALLSTQEHRQRIAEAMVSAGLSKTEANVNAAIIDGHARWWSEQTGKTAAEYYEERGWEFAAGKAPKAGALLQQGPSATRGAIDFMPDGKVRVSFFEAKNVSTAPHEIFHVFLRDMEKISVSGGGTDQFNRDWQTLREWLGAEEGAALTVEQQERFADAGLVYLMEGKSPTTALKGAFTRMRRWLISLYESVRRLDSDVKLSDEMRGVFDRMLGTEAEIKAAQEWMELRPYWQGKPEAMSNERWEQYLKTTSTASDAAAHAIMDRRMRESARLGKIWAKDGEAFANGHHETAILAKLRDIGGIDYADLKASAPEDAKAIYDRHKALFDGADKQTLADAAQMSGFSNKEELVEALRGLRTRKQIVDGYVSERRSEHDAAHPADDLVITPQYEAMLLHESELLAELSGRAGKPIPSDVVKYIVRRTTGQTQIGAIEATITEQDAFKASLQMAARASREAFSAGKIEEAFKQKERQRAIIARLRESIAIRDEIRERKADLAKSAKWAKTSAKKESKNAAQFAAREHVRDLLAQFGVKASPVMFPRELGSLREYLEARQSPTREGERVVADWILDGQGRGRPLHKLTLDELRDLSDAVKHVAYVGRREKEFIRAEGQKSIDAAVAEIAAEIKAAGVKGVEAKGFIDRQKVDENGAPMVDEATGDPIMERIPRFDAARDRSKLKEWISKLKEWIDPTQLLKPETMFRFLVGGKIDVNSAMYRHTFRRAALAETAALEMWEKIEGKFQRLMEIIPFQEQRRWRKDTYDFGFAQGRLTREQMIMVALNSGTQGNLDTLQGWGLSRADTQNVLNALKPHEWQYVRGVWALLGEIGPQLDAVTRDLTGVPMRMTEPIPVSTPGGVIMGGYFPIVLDRKATRAANKHFESELQKNYFENVWRKPQTRRGMTISRTGTKLPTELSIDVLYKHLQDSIHHTSYAVAIRDIDAIVRRDDFRALFEQYLGAEHYDQLIPWLQGMARPRVEYASAIERGLDALRNKTSVVILGAKVSTAIGNIAGYTQTLERVKADTGSYRPALEAVQLFYSHPIEMADFVRSKSVSMRHIDTQWDREARDAISRFDPTRVRIVLGKDSSGRERSISKKEIQQAMFAFINLTEKAVRYPTWIAGYNIGMEKYGGKEELAIEYAEALVRNTQGSAAIKDMSAIQRGSVLTKILTPFYTFFNTFANRMWEAHQGFRNGQISAGRLMMAHVWLAVIPAMWNQFSNDVSIPDTADELRRYLAAIPRQYVGGLPIVRDGAAMIIDYALTGEFYESQPPTLKALASAPLAVNATLRAAVKGNDSHAWYQAFKRSTDAVGFWTGLIPSKQLLTSVEGARQIISGETRNPAVLVWRENRAKKKKKQVNIGGY